MNKALSVVLCVLSVAVSALCFAAWRPVVPAPVQDEAPVPASVDRPAVFETSAVLVLADRPQAAPKARPVAARAKAWGCGGWEDSQVGGRYKRCDWR